MKNPIFTRRFLRKELDKGTGGDWIIYNWCVQASSWKPVFLIRSDAVYQNLYGPCGVVVYIETKHLAVNSMLELDTMKIGIIKSGQNYEEAKSEVISYVHLTTTFWLVVPSSTSVSLQVLPEETREKGTILKLIFLVPIWAPRNLWDVPANMVMHGIVWVFHYIWLEV